MKKLIALLFLFGIIGCANHPVDCAIGIPWADCLEGTQGYINGVGKRINEQGIESEITEKESLNTDLYTELTQLDDLRKKGIITEDEFIQQKEKILRKYNP